MKSRGKYQGTLQIVRFNWPFYITASLLLLGATLIAALIPLPIFVRALLFPGIFFAGFWFVASLVIAYYIYDRSVIYQGKWITPALPHRPARWASFHTGLDEFSDLLRALFPDSEGTIIDFFDPEEMTEPSIMRARRLAKNQPAPLAANFRALPLGDAELDTEFVFFAAHELRKPEARREFFSELHRALKPSGSVLLLEHLRDWSNFLAFGPGCFHFHSRRTWACAIEAAHLSIEKEFSLTPFARAFLLQKANSKHV